MSRAEADALTNRTRTLDGEAAILQSWQGDYPIARLNLLPETQRERSMGFITDAKTFKAVWRAFKPHEAIPEIDFKTDLVLFARNTQFYNRISIGKVRVKNGVADVLAMETMSAVPIEDKLAMSLVVVSSRAQWSNGKRCLLPAPPPAPSSNRSSLRGQRSGAGQRGCRLATHGSL